MKKKSNNKVQTPTNEQLKKKNEKNYQVLTKAEQKKKVAEKKKAKEEKAGYIKKTEKSILDLIPIKKAIDGGETGFELTNKYGYMNIFKILSFDYMSAVEEEFMAHHLIWDGHYRVFSTDEKLVSINMPIDISSQVAFTNHKLNTTTNPLRQKLLIENIDELNNELRTRETKEFYLEIFADSIDELKKLNNRVKAGLCYNGLVREIDYEDKLAVFRKFLNPYNRFAG